MCVCSGFSKCLRMFFTVSPSTAPTHLLCKYSMMGRKPASSPVRVKTGGWGGEDDVAASGRGAFPRAAVEVAGVRA